MNNNPNLIVAHKAAVNGLVELIRVSLYNIMSKLIFSITSKIPAINGVRLIIIP